MLLSPNSFLTSSVIKYSPRPRRTKLSFFDDGNKSSFLTRKYINNKNKNNCGKMSVLYNGYSYFTSPCHPLEKELPNYLQGHQPDDDNDAGIGILDFFRGKNIFITGATGLLGKVLVEKMLRSTLVGKIYLLIKAKDKEAALERLTQEIINSELLTCLKEEQGKSFEGFVRAKLIPIVGNICEPNLGMDSESAEAIRRDVHVIIQSAASTTLNERYDVSLDANVNGPQRLMRFAKTCNNLKLFAHISTAYVNGRREGIIKEKPLIMGDNRRKEMPASSFPQLDVADEINLALKSAAASTDYDATKNLKKLGLERAALYGWYNTYHLTKAMGEMVLNEIRGDVPVLIIRPSVIESTYKEPLPGWIQGNRMFDPVIVSYGKGQLPAFLADSRLAMDITPVDMVANTTIAAMAKHGNKEKSDLNVYHVSSSLMNPLIYSDFFEYLYEYFSSSPMNGSQNSIERIKLFDNFEDFSKYMRDETSRRSGDENRIKKTKSQCKAMVAYAEQLCKMYEFIGLFNARFDNGNSRKLLKEMSKEEKLTFEVDAMNIDWKKYFMEVHIPGLRKHIINGTRTST